MKIEKPAIAGTLESSDCMVTVEPGNGTIAMNLESVRGTDSEGGKRNIRKTASR